MFAKSAVIKYEYGYEFSEKGKVKRRNTTQARQMQLKCRKCMQFRLYAHSCEMIRPRAIRAERSDCHMHPQTHSHEAHISKAVDDVFAAQTYSQTVEMLGTSISFPHCSEELSAHSDQVQTRQNSQSRTELRSGNLAMATCYPSYELPTQPSRTVQVPVQKDYSRPLHVDCSVEYELPNQAKPPQGVRNEPLLMIHPCYFRKIESQRRSPFVNNLPPTTRQPSATKRRVARTQQQQIPQQIPQQAAQYPIQYTATVATERQQPQQQHHHHQQLWEPMPPLVPISAAAAVQQTYCKREAAMVSGCGTYSSGSGDSGHWTDPDRSPDRPEDKHILTGKYRQYLRAHRLHPYVSSAIPIASTFPQIQQVCYNV